MRIRIGTSGYSFKQWKGPFYPEKWPDKRMLEYYGERLDTVEINYTFRRIPKTSVVLNWCDKVPDDFAFALKASQRITHWQRLKDCEEVLGVLAERITAMGDQLGATLFQLPPSFKKDAERLRTFLGLVPGELRAAFEFRNDSWFDDETYDILREHDATLVVSEMDDKPPPLVPTSDRGYLRLRREDYDRAALSDWAKRIQDQPWKSVQVFFKHEDEGAGPRLAQELRELL